MHSRETIARLPCDSLRSCCDRVTIIVFCLFPCDQSSARNRVVRARAVEPFETVSLGVGGIYNAAGPWHFKLVVAVAVYTTSLYIRVNT